ncbi:crotonobetainyl-CoA hydratase [Nocardioides sp. J9]|uniref:crotonase/enoyl-CoA hydratase family protein n=1 Tax=Nocardioides sp. J9 TaxID=935844 RepID=UPI0011ABDF71|nr:crotonase/enoyl-CoA hydratase family protein [Nocardioides sp. J9]TWG98550.1 crotonobetainyl-CoA hydratase [Nocardioides sp. J9]
MIPIIEELLGERHGHVLVLTINRPEARNAVNQRLSVAMGEALECADGDPDVRAIVVTGAGSAAFCAGADLRAAARGESVHHPDPELAMRWGFAGITNHAISTPLIAAVNGFALGGGTEILLACDLAVASSTAVFGLPEVTHGLHAAAGGALRLPAQIPAKIAMELLLTGDRFDAETAFRWGLVNRVVEPEDLLPATLELAARIARNGPLAVAATKRGARSIIDGQFAAEEQSWNIARRELAQLLLSEDASEGKRAFAEGRSPEWKGR